MKLTLNNGDSPGPGRFDRPNARSAQSCVKGENALRDLLNYIPEANLIVELNDVNSQIRWIVVGRKGLHDFLLKRRWRVRQDIGRR